jgi:hypothetical protein
MHYLTYSMYYQCTIAHVTMELEEQPFALFLMLFFFSQSIALVAALTYFVTYQCRCFLDLWLC